MNYPILFSTIFAIGSLTTPAHAQSELAREYERLKEQRAKALAAAAEPINRKYEESLDQLFRRANQAGSVELAVKIKAEIQSMGTESSNPLAPLFGIWHALYSKTNSDIVTIRPDKTASCAKGPTGVWEADDKNMVISWNNGVIFRIPIATAGDKMRAEHKSIDEGRWNSFTLNRQ